MRIIYITQLAIRGVGAGEMSGDYYGSMHDLYIQLRSIRSNELLVFNRNPSIMIDFDNVR